MNERDFVPIKVAVLTISDTRTEETDRSGAQAIELLTAAGHEIVARRIIPDDLETIRAQFGEWIADPTVDVVISTGGTGITTRDVTPEALEPHVTKPIPGFGELFRALSYEEIATSTIQSRATGGLCGSTLAFALPGSPGAVRLALERIIIPQLDSRTRPCNFVELMPRIRAGAG